MTYEEFVAFIEQHSELKSVLNQVMPIEQIHGFGKIRDATIVVSVFFLVKFVLLDIGLPWQHEAQRYSELWRTKTHIWIDEQYRKNGMDPDAVEAASERLRQKLEATHAPVLREGWEILKKKLEDES